MKAHNRDSSGRADELQQIRDHFEAIPSFSDLNHKLRGEFFSWLERSFPFRNLDDFRAQLQQAKMKGFKQEHYSAIVDSLQLRISRRPFLAAFTSAAFVSLCSGIATSASGSDAPPANSAATFRQLVGAIQQQEQTIGQFMQGLVNRGQSLDGSELSNTAAWEPFLHALDMSNWSQAALALQEPDFRKALESGARGTVLTPLLAALGDLRVAWNYLLSNRNCWEHEYFVAYAFGRMATLSPGQRDQPAFPKADPQAEAHAKSIHNVAPQFHVLEVMNQRFQRPGVSSQGASVRCTQGHNFAYAHLASHLEDRTKFPDDQPIVLVNWDAHADLSGPYENPKLPVEDAFNALQNAASFSQRVVVASSMSIAGWLLPLIYQGFLRPQNGPAKLVWVVPRESLETSHNYMEPYGKYSIVVGDWLLPESPAEIAEFSTTAVGEWNHPGTREIRHYSDRKTLCSIIDPELLNNRQRCDLHIVDPADSQQLEALCAGSRIALSVDADFSGTREPGLLPRKGYLPHYPLTKTAEKRERHNQLLEQLAAFYAQRRTQIGAISIANSPNFTADAEARKPVGKILRIVAGDDLVDQPEWLQREVKRSDQPTGDAQQVSAGEVLSVGGLAGLGIAASLLTRDWLRLRTIRNLLFDEKSSH